MTDFGNGELFAYVRGDSMRRDMLGVASEMRMNAEAYWDNGMAEHYDANMRKACHHAARLMREWADRLERASEELHLELGQVKSRARDDAYYCWYSTGDTAACTPVENMVRFENSGWSHVERGGDDDWCEIVLGEDDFGCTATVCSKCLGVVDDAVKPSFCKWCGRHVR